MTSIAHATFFVLIATVIEAIGLTILRQGSTYAIPMTSAIFALGVVPLLHMSLQYEGIGLTNFLWNIFSTLVMFAIGVYIFKEKTKKLQFMGVLVSLLGVGMILMSPEDK
jgi:multidrug transporter EmrE-like cation transporter